MAELKKISELPKEKIHLLCKYDLERAKYWFYSMYSGKSYIIPVDKKMNKIIKKVELWDFEQVVRDIIASVYLQIRLQIGDNIERSLSQQIDNGFRKLYSPNVRKKIEEQFNLLDFKKEKEADKQ